MSLDLNKGYSHIQLSEDTRNLCMIILPWVEYHYNNLTMGAISSPDIFHQKMNVFQGF